MADAKLLVIWHSNSGATQEMVDAVLAGCRDPEAGDVEVRDVHALEATADDVLWCDGVILGTPAHFGYMSGALKHFFDTIYYPCLEDTVGRPYGLYVHGNDDTAGALAALGKITTGLRWRAAQAPLSIVGAPGRADLDAAWELGASLGAQLLL